MEHLSHLVGAYSRIIHLDCLFAYLFRILSPLCFRRICLFAMSADIPLRSAARESHLPLLCCCSAFRAFLLFLFHASIISLLLTFCQLPDTDRYILDGETTFDKTDNNYTFNGTVSDHIAINVCASDAPSPLYPSNTSAPFPTWAIIVLSICGAGLIICIA